MIRVERTPPRPQLRIVIDDVDYELRIEGQGHFELTKPGAERPYHITPEASCDCEAFTFKGECKHLKALFEVHLL